MTDYFANPSAYFLFNHQHISIHLQVGKQVMGKKADSGGSKEDVSESRFGIVFRVYRGLYYPLM